MTKSPEGVYMVMGVNGVGKSTLTHEMALTLPDAHILHGSRELRNLFGGISRIDLEQLDPTEKLRRRSEHFLNLFRQLREDKRIVIMDTHLLVPIRNETSVRYENTWVDEYAEFVTGACMLTANVTDIKGWREADEMVSGRRRDLSEVNIGRDQELNMHEFTTLIEQGMLPPGAKIIENQVNCVQAIGTRIIREEFALAAD